MAVRFVKSLLAKWILEDLGMKLKSVFAALVAAAAVSGFLGLGMAVNYASVFIAAVLGVPGVIGLSVLMFFL